MSRKTSREERALFQKHVVEALLKPVAPKSKSRKKAISELGRDHPPPRGRSPLEGEVAVAALAGAQANAGAPKAKLGRPEGDNKDQLDGHTAEKLRRGQLVPARRIDLHGQTEAAAHRALHAFLVRAQAEGLRLVLVITGIGNPKRHEGAEWMQPSHGTLKEMVPRWLGERDFSALISGWAASHTRYGGAGALYVYLSKKK